MKNPVSVEEIYRLFKKYHKVCTDTRKIEQGSIFFALKGENFDANDFALEAIEKGCSCAVVDNPSLSGKEGCLYVENTLQTLQKLAVMYRKEMMIPVIGITGTNGKTTTKELIRSVLSVRYKTYATEGNLNNHIGVPLTLLSMPQDTEIAIIEMGANHPGEIAQLCRIALPVFGLITNIGEAHLEGFGSFAKIVETKIALYEFLRKVHGKAFVNAQNNILMHASSSLDRYCYGSKADIFLQMTATETDQLNLSCCLCGPASTPTLTEIKTHLVGSYNLENVAAAACVGRYFGLNDSEIKKGIQMYEPNNMRSQCIKTLSNQIIADTYNANPTSMKASLDNFCRLNTTGIRTVILGDMLELGTASRHEHQKIVDMLKSSNIMKVFLVGNNFSKTDNPKDYKVFANVEKLLAALEKDPVQNHCILIKGSHGIHLEKAVEYFKSY